MGDHFWFFFFIFLVITSSIGGWIGEMRGRKALGFVLGFLLGPFGILIVLLLPATPEAQAEHDRQVARATGAPVNAAQTGSSRKRAIAEAIHRDPSLAEANDSESLARLDDAVTRIMREQQLRAELDEVLTGEQVDPPRRHPTQAEWVLIAVLALAVAVMVYGWVS